MKVKVIEEKCISCGLCANIASDIFTLEDSDKARVKKQPDDKEEVVARNAAEGCPTEAIEVEQ